MKPESNDPRFRTVVEPADAGRVRRLTEATGFFSAAEVDIAVELVEETIEKGEAAGYRFLFTGGKDGELDGYSCFGPIPCTLHSYDLYWIAVRPGLQGRGLGRALMVATERAIQVAGGLRAYVDTSGRAQYAPTRRFYETCGYRVAAVFDDFYAPADAKVVYGKVLG